MSTNKMKTLQDNRNFLLIALCLSFCVISYCQKQSSEPTCLFSILDNVTLYNQLSKWFDKDSRTFIVEYTIRIMNDNGGLNLYEQSSPDLFQPWRWYRTEGYGNSRVLQTYDFYFGLLKMILALGIETVDLNLNVTPPGCLNVVDKNTLDTLLINFLLQDLNIADYSPNLARADIVEICRAKIVAHDGDGKLVYHCCSYDDHDIITCDEDPSSEWAFALNITVCVLSCLFAIIIIWVFGKHNDEEPKRSRKVSGNYILEYNYTFLLYLHGAGDNQNIPRLPTSTLEEMSNLSSTIEPLGRGRYVINVKKTSVNVPDKLISELDQIDFLNRKLKDILLIVKKRPTWKRFGIIFTILVLLIVPSIPFFLIMLSSSSWYKDLEYAYRERELQGPFYFQWAHYDEKRISLIFLGWIAVCTILCIFTYTFWPMLPDKKYMKFFSPAVFLVLALFFLPLLLIDIIFAVSLSIMLIFTIIIQVRTLANVVQGVVTLFLYARSFYLNYWSKRVALKSNLLNALRKNSRFKEQMSVSVITAETLENHLQILQIDYVNSRIELNRFAIENRQLHLQIPATLLFIDEYDVASITKNFFFRCLKFDSLSVPAKLSCLKLSKIGMMLLIAAGFITLVIITFLAYGDIYHISPSNSFLYSMIVSIVPLLVQHLKTKDLSQNRKQYLDRRFFLELMKEIQGSQSYLTVNDFIDFNIQEALTDQFNLKLKYDAQDVQIFFPDCVNHECIPLQLNA